MTSDPSDTTSGKSILVVDDDIHFRRTLVQALQMGGHTVFEMAGRTEVMRALTTRQFDLVMTDVIMPEFDGTEVIREVKKLQPKAALIAMSGGGQYMTRDLSLDLTKPLGVAAMLRKPLKLEALINAVEFALGSVQA